MKRLILVLAALSSACSFLGREDRFPRGMSDEVTRSVRRSAESHTLSRLAALERSLNDYIQATGKVPAKLNALVPDYLAEIPDVEMGLKDHKDRSEVTRSVRRSAESHTLSRLAALERSLNDYIQATGKVPTKLNVLVPDYLAEIPDVEMGLKDHKDRSEVRYYPASVIVGGGINGAALGDSGGWGYAYNDKRVIVFVDCTHQRMDGSLWYKARGVF